MRFSALSTMHIFSCLVAVFLLTVLPALGQVDSDPLDTGVDTAVPPTLTAMPSNTGLGTYQVGPTSTVGAQNKIGTFLYSYDGCGTSSSQPYYKGYINEGYYDAWLISNAPGVKSGINFNSAVGHRFKECMYTSTKIPARGGLFRTPRLERAAAETDASSLGQHGDHDL